MQSMLGEHGRRRKGGFGSSIWIMAKRAESQKVYEQKRQCQERRRQLVRGRGPKEQLVCFDFQLECFPTVPRLLCLLLLLFFFEFLYAMEELLAICLALLGELVRASLMQI